MLRRSRDQPKQGPSGRIAARVLLSALLASAAAAQPATAFELFGLKLWGSSEEDIEIADPLEYTVTLDVAGDDGDLKDKLEDASSLVDDEDRPVSGSLGLMAKARADREQLIAALYREARYDGVVNIAIAGRPIDDIPPDADFGEGPVPVAISVEPGSVFKLGAVVLGGDAAGLMPEKFGLVPGGDAGSGIILKAEADIVRALKEEGRPLARVTGRDIVADHATLTVAVTLTVAAGPVATYGDTSVEGTKDVDNEFTAYMTGLKRGETYSPKDIDDARDRLVDLGVFSSVNVREAEALDPDGSIPIDVEVSERKFRYYGVGATMSNTEGLGVEGYWGHRNLFGHAEKLRIEGSISRIGDTRDYGKLNYNAAIMFEKPGVLGPASKFFSNVKTVFEHPDAYDRFSVKAGAGVEYALTKTQKVSAELATEWSKIEDFFHPDGERHFLVSIPLQYVFDNRDNRLNPKSGFRVLAYGEPTYDFLTGASFLKMKGEASAYRAIDVGGKFVAAARFAGGSIVGASLSDIPADRRFYAGGGGSVRGYAYQGIGPKDALGEPTGGRSFAEGSLEMRIAVTDTLGVVPFIDAGTVSTAQFPDFSDVKVGAGIGLRYLTPFGPLRIDAAIPLNREPGDPRFGIYAGIGQAF
jgi:translocation and assembly module TamA